MEPFPCRQCYVNENSTSNEKEEKPHAFFWVRNEEFPEKSRIKRRTEIQTGTLDWNREEIPFAPPPVFVSKKKADSLKESTSKPHEKAKPF
jgi:hypothetical protein